MAGGGQSGPVDSFALKAKLIHSPPGPPPQARPVQVLLRLQRRIEKRMESLQRVKLDGFEPVIAELKPNWISCAGRSGIWRSNLPGPGATAEKRYSSFMDQDKPKLIASLIRASDGEARHLLLSCIDGSSATNLVQLVRGIENSSGNGY
jgi:hypothetical protein